MGNQMAKNDVIEMTGQCVICMSIAPIRRLFEPVLCPECLLRRTYIRGDDVNDFDPFKEISNDE